MTQWQMSLTAKRYLVCTHCLLQEQALWKANIDCDLDLIRNINDPEHPLTLEQLNVTQIDHIEVDGAEDKVVVYFTPTIPHCSMATLIGLCIRVRLLRALPERFKVHKRNETGHAEPSD